MNQGSCTNQKVGAGRAHALEAWGCEWVPLDVGLPRVRKHALTPPSPLTWETKWTVVRDEVPLGGASGTGVLGVTDDKGIGNEDDCSEPIEWAGRPQTVLRTPGWTRQTQEDESWKATRKAGQTQSSRGRIVAQKSHGKLAQWDNMTNQDGKMTVE